MPRLFFALWPGDFERDRLFEAAQRAHPHSGGRIMRRENLHQTVVFIGNVTDAEAATLKAAAETIETSGFTLQFGALRYWRHNRIVWAAPIATPAPLRALVRALEGRLEAAGIRYDKRDYQPHITLIRDARPPGAMPPLEFAWPVREFALIESARDNRGTGYRPIARWPLAV